MTHDKSYYTITSQHIDWVARRLRLDPEDIRFKKKFLQKPEGFDGIKVTIPQLEEFANFAHAPLGYFLSDEPPEESIPLPDFRTHYDDLISYPSANLLDIIYDCQRRQRWYRKYALFHGFDGVSFIGSAKEESNPYEVAENIRKSFSSFAEKQTGKRKDFLNYLISSIESLGVLVMRSSHAKTDPKRMLDVKEFRGFSMADKFAPIIFINSKDTKPGQIFTLIHEFAHLWAGESALSDVRDGDVDQKSREWWANSVANEVLLPGKRLLSETKDMSFETTDLERLSDSFHVGTLVILKRLYHLGKISYKDYQKKYEEEGMRLREALEAKEKNKARQKGVDTYFHARKRKEAVGAKFANAVIEDTYLGNMLYRDAYRLLGVSNSGALKKLDTFLYEDSRQEI